jgi:hypothetical protein
MPLQKQPASINFAQGLDTKTDPFQVQAGAMLQLVNSIFTKGGMLQKRNGNQLLATLNTAADQLAVFKGNAIAIGTRVQMLSQSTKTWLDKGPYTEASLSAVPVVRTATSQLTCDVAVNQGLACSTWLDSDTKCYYQVTEADTGQVAVSRVALPTGAAMPRVFTLGQFFIVTYLMPILGFSLYYIAIPILTPTAATTPASLSDQVKSLTAGYDGYVDTSTNNLYLAFSGADGGGSIRATMLDQFLIQHVTKTFSGVSPDLISVTIDLTSNLYRIYISYWNTGSTNGFVLNTDPNLIPTASPVAIITGEAVVALTSVAQNNKVSVYYEVSTVYSGSSVRSDIIKKTTCTNLGITTVPTLLLRSVGLASKAFLVDSMPYMAVTYGGSLQPANFLIEDIGTIVAKPGQIVSRFAYSNSGGYATTQVLPSVTVINNVASMGYLFKDQITAVNKSQNAPSVAGIYSQTGINLANFTIGSVQVGNAEIGGALHLTGGMLWMYDGGYPVEHGFNVFPEDIGYTPATTGGSMLNQVYNYQVTYEWTDASGNLHRSAPSIPTAVTVVAGTPITLTSTFAAATTSITVSSVTGLYVGQVLTNTTTSASLYPNTYITSIVGLVVGLSLPTATASAGADTLQTITTGSVTLIIPTLRLTYKIAPNPVRIVIYRWSVAQLNFYQITSVLSPIINDTTIDTITYVDTQADSSIIGNQLLYTTGGVLENIPAPSVKNLTIFKSRLWLIDGEDQNTLWYSKITLQNTPVEMSDLQTIYVSPTISSQGSTGTNQCLFPMDDKICLFKSDAIYYITGNGPDITGANNDYGDPTFIPATVGCSNPNSIVFTPNGLMFQSDKGIWLLGRDLSTKYIGAPVEAYNASKVLSAVSIPGQNQIRFTLDSGVTLMYDYYYNQWGTFEGMSGTSSVIYQGLHTYINSNSETLQENPGSFLDGTRPVNMKFTTAWIQLAGLQGFQRAYYFYLLGQYFSPHKLNIAIAYDYNPSPTQTTIVTPVNFNGKYGSDPIYGDGDIFGGESQVEQWRIFLDTQKCSSFQITISEAFDPQFGAALAGAGLTLSGLNLVVGIKKSYRTQSARTSTG